METNLELGQVDRLLQSGVEPCLTTQVRVTTPDRDVKVSVLCAFASVGSLTGLRTWVQPLRA